MTRDEHPSDDTRLGEALRRALEEEAASVQVGEDGLDAIRARTGRGPRRWWPVVAASAAALVVAAGIGIAVLGDGEGPVTTTPAPAGSPAAPSDIPSPQPPAPTTTPSATDEPPVAGSLTVPAYYVTDTTAGLRLAREFRTVLSLGDPVGTAVQTMLDGAADPDYASLWNPGARVLGVDVGDEVIEVDLSAAARQANVGAEAAELAVQQLVYTATAAAQSDAAVRVLVEGSPVDELFGHVDTSRPVRRADPLSVRLLVQVNDPAEGAVVGSPVRVSGEAATFEANVPWQVLRDGAVVREGFTTAQECCRLAPFAFDVELEPGTYELVVTEDDPSAGEGRPPMRDTKTFTVRG